MEVAMGDIDRPSRMFRVRTPGQILIAYGV
jgi:hypothetical protein